MPSVDVTSLITGLNPIRHTSSYTMPVLSPRHGSSSLTGSYRSTYSSSSIDRPYSNYTSPRSYSYSERYTRSYGVDDGKKLRHSSIAEDGVTSRFKEESRESSTKRDVSRNDSSFRDGTSQRSNSLRNNYTRDSSLTRLTDSGGSSKNEMISIKVLESVADIRSKYSPANYVPAILRKSDYTSRSKSINLDIGKPPIERTEPKAIKLKKVNNENGVSNGLALTNTTNDNNELGDDNGNRTSVADIRKKFDSNHYNLTPVAEIRKKFDSNHYNLAPGAEIRKNFSLNRKKNLLLIQNDKKTINDNNKTNTNNDPLLLITKSHQNTNDETDTLVNTKLFNGRPPKCSKTIDVIPQEVPAEDNSTEVTVNLTKNKTWTTTTDNPMDVSVTLKVYNHTTNFASYIPSKEAANERMNEGDDSDGEMESTDTTATVNAIVNATANATINSAINSTVNDTVTSTATTTDNYYQRNVNNDLSTSPRLNRSSLTQNNVASTSTSPINSILPNSIQRSSPITSEERSSYDKLSIGTSNIKNQGLNGLKNIGNTCFMNSVIQCLSNTKYLLEYVKGDHFMDDLNTTISGMKGALIKAFGQVIQELWSPDSSDRVVNTLALKSQIQRFAPRFIGYSQQDAQEFLRYLLEGLHEDVNRVTSKPTPIHTEIDEKLSDSQKANEAWGRYLRMDNSKVVDIFVGQLKSTLRCTHCGHCSVTFDPFWDLSLPIPQRQGQLRLQQCLEHFTREETLDGDEKPTCSKCKERRKCTKSFSIQKFPKILVIHLKRFSPTERFRGKLNVIIDFPLTQLDLSQYAATSGHTDCVYNLYAISNHSGTTYSGHYTAYCKHPYSGQWHEYNDSRVSSISPKNIVSSEAYVLFYELVGNHSHL